MENSCNDKNQKVIICVSGMTGSGKSTVAKKLAEKYDLTYFSGGNAMRELAKEEGYHSNVNGWWESPEGLGFLKTRKGDPAFDKKIDEKLLELAEKGNIVLDSWTVPWLLKDKGFKISDEIYRTDAPLYSRSKQRVLMSLDNEIRLDTDFPHRHNGVLGRLGFHFTYRL